MFILDVTDPIMGAQQDAQSLPLGGDYLAMGTVRNGGHSLLYVMTSRATSTIQSRKYIEIFTKEISGGLRKAQEIPIEPEIVGYDICPDPTTPQSDQFLMIGPKGIYKIGDSRPFLAHETILAHDRTDSLVRVKICFDLFKGEASAFAIPQIHGLDVFRYTQNKTYHHVAHFPVHADARYLWPLIRGAQTSIQRIAVRFEYPDVNAVDFNGDGYTDICFSSSDSIRCVFQDGKLGFVNHLKPQIFFINLMTAAEKKDSSKRIETKLIDITGDKRPELIVSKSNWNLSEIGTNLYIYHQHPQNLFQPKPIQIIARDGYFGFQEYWDFDSDGLLDLTAPTATTTWTDIAAAYLTKKVSLEFVLYKNKSGKFDETPNILHSMKYPIDFRNWASLLGCLPLWNIKIGQRDSGVIFFPMGRSIELRSLNKEQGIINETLWSASADIGGEVQAIDLDQDTKNEVVIAYPKDVNHSTKLLYFNTPKSIQQL
jgi:hypothetical protein